MFPIRARPVREATLVTQFRGISGLRALIAVALAIMLLGAGGEPATVRIALREQPNSLDPLITTQFDENYVTEGIFSGLTVLDDRGNAQPDLAEAVPTHANGGISADGKTLTYRLRANARWQDGVPVTADDVVFTFAKMRDPQVPFPFVSTYAVVRSVEARGPHVVLVRLNRPAPDAPYELFVNGQNGAIVPKHILEHERDIAHSNFNTAPIGSGPYRLASWQRGEGLELVANPAYFRGVPQIGRIDVSFVPDANTRAFMLQSHAVDLARIEPPNAPAARATAGVRVESVLTPTLYYLEFRTDAPPFDDVRVRRALATLVDRREVAEKTFLGQAVAADDWLLPSSPFHTQLPVVPSDVRASGALLDAAGWLEGPGGLRRRAGRPLEVVLTTVTGSPTALRLAVVLQAVWRPLGVSLSVRTLQTDLLYAPAGVLARGDFSVSMLPFGFPVTPDRSMLLSTSALPPAGYNYSRTRDAELDRWFEEARSGTDDAKRKRLYRRIAERVANRIPIYPLVWEKALFGIATRLEGIKLEPVNSDLWNVWQWRVTASRS